jgi:CRP-like cAMP-binding protein
MRWEGAGGPGTAMYSARALRALPGHPVVPTTPCHVLSLDPALAGGLEGERLARAVQECIAAEVVVGVGAWEPQRAEGAAVRGGIGLLLIEGLVTRRVGGDGRYGLELLGPGDLLRPWRHDGEDMTLPLQSDFRVLERTRVALLDLHFAARVARYPELVGAFVGRAVERSRTLAVSMAIAHYPRIDRRLLLLLWHLADRWGRVTPEGIRIPLGLTHATLADLVASRRPSVTTALSLLEREGLLTRHGHVFVLHGEPPIGLYETEERSDSAGA